MARHLLVAPPATMVSHVGMDDRRPFLQHLYLISGTVDSNATGVGVEVHKLVRDTLAALREL